jgi:transcriptional regulator with XRE-family HTH domain
MDSQEIILKNIGLRLQKLRESKGFTSYERFAIEHEISRMHYWQIEKGKINLTIKTLSKYLEIHEISIETFFNLEI